MSKSYFVVTSHWSQTDKDSYLVRADSLQEVKQLYAKRRENGPAYVDVHEVGSELYDIVNGKLVKATSN